MQRLIISLALVSLALCEVRNTSAQAVSPAAVEQAQLAMKPLLERYGITAIPELIQAPLLVQNVPNFLFFVVPSLDDTKGLEVVMSGPQGSITSTLEYADSNSTPIAEMLKEHFHAFSEEDALRYVQTHFQLVRATMPKRRFGEMGQIVVSKNSTGLLAMAAIPIVQSAEGPENPPRFQLRVQFDASGTLELGKSRFGWLRSTKSADIATPAGDEEMIAEPIRPIIPPAAGLAHSAPSDLKIPQLIFPANHATVPNGPPLRERYEWTAVEGASAYEIQIIHPNDTPETSPKTSGIFDTQYARVREFPVYWDRNGWTWRVRAEVNGQWMGWSSMGQFDFASLAEVEVEISNDSSIETEVSLDRIVSKKPSDRSGHMRGAVGKVPPNQVLKLRGLAGDTWKFKQEGQSAGQYTATNEPKQQYAITATYRSTPSLISPTLIVPNAFPGKADGPALLVWNFQWSPVDNASEYELFVMNSDDRAPLLYVDGISEKVEGITKSSDGAIIYHYVDENFVPQDRLQGWLWRIRAKVSGDWMPWSATQQFEVKAVNPHFEPLVERMRSMQHACVPGQPLLASVYFTGSEYSITYFHTYRQRLLDGSMRDVTTAADFRYPLDKITFESRNGDVLPKDKARAWFAKPRPVLISAPDHPLDPQYASLLADNVLLAKPDFSAHYEKKHAAHSWRTRDQALRGTPTVALNYLTVAFDGTEYVATTVGLRQELVTKEEYGRTVTVPEWGPDFIKERFPETSVTFKSVAGKFGDPATMRQFLRNGHVAVELDENATLAPFYKSALAPNTIVVKRNRLIGGRDSSSEKSP
jgi:hypothetical protein